uniref:Ion_trans domain-containing protein n=1 Tax=Caenorhabditis tropicalis TaxID=1561998 RepID=A0A1I7U7R3_9PELO
MADVEETTNRSSVEEEVRIPRKLEYTSHKFAAIMFTTDEFFWFAFIALYIYLVIVTHSARLLPADQNKFKNSAEAEDLPVFPLFVTSEVLKLIIAFASLGVSQSIFQATHASARRAKRVTKYLTVFRVFAGQLDLFMIALGGSESFKYIPLTGYIIGGVLIFLEVVWSFGKLKDDNSLRQNTFSVAIYIAKKLTAPLDEFLFENNDSIELISVSGMELTPPERPMDIADNYI